MKLIIKILWLALLLSVSLFGNQTNEVKVADSANEVCPIKISEEVPSVNIETIDGKKIDIREVIKESKSIIIFYRGGWCPYCNMHLSELQQVEDDVLALGYKLIAISIDKPEKLNESLQEHNLSYQLYSDSKAEASKAFGIAFKVEDSQVEMLKNHNMDLEKSSGEQHHILPVPSVFITDEEGKIIFEYVNPDYKIRMSGNLLLEVVKNLQAK